MKAKEIEVGGTYLAKVSGRLTIVRVNRIEPHYDFLTGRPKTMYCVTNLRTGRRTTFHSPSKFRARAEKKEDGKWHVVG